MQNENLQQSQYPTLISPKGEILSPAVVNPEVYRHIPTLLATAREAKADPRQSGFFVMSAVLSPEGKAVHGGNKEHNGISDAWTHGETAALNVAIEQGFTPVALGFFGEDAVKHNLAGCCGRCRDIFSSYIDPTMPVIEGDDKAVYFNHFSDFLFTDYSQEKGIHKVALEAAKKALFEGFDMFLPNKEKRLNYGVAMVLENGKIIKGRSYTNAGYYSVPPLLSAKLAYIEMAYEMHDLPKIDRIVIVGRDGKYPPVLYADRQDALELQELLNFRHETFEPIPIEMTTLESDTVWDTDSRIWMPYPFSAGSFGMTNVIEAQVNKILNT